MSKETKVGLAHPAGVQPFSEVVPSAAVLETYGGRVHVEWDEAAPVTPLGQLPFFIEFLKQGGVFDGWVADCPLAWTSPNAPKTRNILGTVMLSVLAGHRRYAHITAIRGDGVNAPVLGMSKVVSEDAVRRAFQKMEAGAGIAWLRGHLDYCTRGLLSEPWVLDVDTTVKPLFGHQEGAVVGYNPHKRGRPSHVHHTYMLSNLRLVLEVEVQAGNQHNSKHSAPGLWALLERLGRARWPALLRADNNFGTEPVMSRAEVEGLPYLFRLRATKNVKRAIERAMGATDWEEAGQGWQGKEASLRLVGWSRARRVVILRRRVKQPLAVSEQKPGGQLALGFVEVGAKQEVWEYGVLVTSLTDEIRTLAQLYRDRADSENVFDELKNQWGWGGFTTQDLKRCRLMARCIALIYNWWSLFVRLADPDRHLEAITSRPLLLHAVARQTRHAGQTTLIVSSLHGMREHARAALARIAKFFAALRSTAEQLSAEQRWYRILSEALRKYLRGRQLTPPLPLQHA